MTSIARELARLYCSKVHLARACTYCRLKRGVRDLLRMMNEQHSQILHQLQHGQRNRKDKSKQVTRCTWQCCMS